MKTRHEHEEQVAVFEWSAKMSKKYPELRLLFAIPNGGLRNKVVAKKLKAEGVKSGIPDMFLPVAHKNFFGLFIELKRRGGKGPTEKQREWLMDLVSEGYDCYCCKGSDAAIKVISDYIGIKTD